MALHEIKSKTDTLRIEKGTSASGFLVGMQRNVGKFKSNIYTLRQSTGGETKVWGCADIDNKLAPGHKLSRELVGVWVELSPGGLRKLKGRKKTMRLVKVMADPQRTIRGK